MNWIPSSASIVFSGGCFYEKKNNAGIPLCFDFFSWLRRHKTDSDEDATKGSQVSSTQSVSKPETGSDIVTSEESASLTFADEEMELYVRKLIGREEGDLTAGDVETVDALYLGNKDIHTINGIEHFTNLRILHLNDTQIREISALAGLKQLEYLDISRTQIKEIKALADLTKLKTLYLNNNQLNDITALAGLKQLEVLHMNDTVVSDIQPLTELS